jgi:sialate O-acetylesterase
MQERMKRMLALLAGLMMSLNLLVGEIPNRLNLPPIFADQMILQREIPCNIWGQGKPGGKVTVAFNGQQKQVSVRSDGTWLLALDPMEALAEPQEMVVSTDSGERISLKMVRVGEVWFCSGQSNMAFPVGRLIPKDASADHPLIKETLSSSFPQVYEFSRSWKMVDKNSISNVSGAGYFFAKALYEHLQVPIGIISSAHSSSPLEAWVRRELVEEEPKCRPVLDHWQAEIDAWNVDDGLTVIREAKLKHEKWLASVQVNRPDFTRDFRAPSDPSIHPFIPGNLFTEKVVPFIPFTIRGIIWYQGETNANPRYLTGAGVKAYQSLFPTMIRDWREQWGWPELPFYFVQLAGFGKPATTPGGDDDWAALRDVQLKTLALPNTGMAVAIDIGEAGDIHPWNKIDLGDRLARWALHHAYGDRSITPSGPLFRSSEIVGNKMILEFDYAESGLVVGTKTGIEPIERNEDCSLDRIAIAGEDGVYVWAEAHVRGSTLEVSSPSVTHPVALRYLWESMPPEGARLLYNAAGLPASPFQVTHESIP